MQTDQGLLEQLGSATSFMLNDALGSVRTVASPTASVVGTASYDAFGSVRSQTGQSSIFGFTGQQTDATGLSYLRARYYDHGQLPVTGQRATKRPVDAGLRPVFVCHQQSDDIRGSDRK